MRKQKLITVNVRMPVAVHRKFKSLATKEMVPMQYVLLRCIKEYIDATDH